MSLNIRNSLMLARNFLVADSAKKGEDVTIFWPNTGKFFSKRCHILYHMWLLHVGFSLNLVAVSRYQDHQHYLRPCSLAHTAAG